MLPCMILGRVYDSATSSSLLRTPKNKSVSFAPDSKAHDGVAPSSLLLQGLIVHAHRLELDGRPFGQRELLAWVTAGGRMRAKFLPALTNKIGQLVLRLRRVKSERKPKLYVVPQLHGLQSLVLPVSYLASAFTLYQLCANAYLRIQQICFQRKVAVCSLMHSAAAMPISKTAAGSMNSHATGEERVEETGAYLSLSTGGRSSDSPAYGLVTAEASPSGTHTLCHAHAANGSGPLISHD